jgi:hypothetical protein
MRSLHDRQWPGGRGLHGGGVCAREEDAGRARAKERDARGLKHVSYRTREGEGATTVPNRPLMARGATGGSRYSRGRLIEVKWKRVKVGGK